MIACQWASERPCEEPAAYLITVRTESGLELVEAQCRGHVSRRADQVSAEGGSVIAARGLPEPPAVRLEPVGLDAISPSVAVQQ